MYDTVTKAQYVRVSLKGSDEEEFSRLTGAQPQDFRLQLAALEHLLHADVRVHPAVMVSFSPAKNIEALRSRLSHITPRFADFEVEELELYGDVAQRLEKAGIDFYTVFEPTHIPPEQV